MEASEFARALRELVELAQEEDFDGDGEVFVNAGPDVQTLLNEDTTVRTFREAGVLSRDAGLVFRLADGSTVQVTVVVAR